MAEAGSDVKESKKNTQKEYKKRSVNEVTEVTPDRMLLFFAGEDPQFKGGGFQIATPVGGTD